MQNKEYVVKLTWRECFKLQILVDAEIEKQKGYLRMLSRIDKTFLMASTEEHLRTLETLKQKLEGAEICE